MEVVQRFLTRTLAVAATCTALAQGGDSAKAVTVIPAGEVIAKGKLRYKKSFVTLECETTFISHITEDGQLTVHSAAFGSRGLCRHITALALPWHGQAQGTNALVIFDASVNVNFPLLGGVCGPSRLELEWDNALSTLTFKDVVLKAPEGSHCTASGVVNVTPP